MCVTAQKVCLKVADGDSVTELVVVDGCRGGAPAGAAIAQVQILRVSGPPAIGHPERPLVVGSVLLGYYNGGAVLISND